jgi:two-component system, cell cycle sensor histidine kinase and response regulator CckA
MPQGSATETRTRKPVVFFVDDEDGVRHIANRLLRKRGFDMIGASSAAHASDVIDEYEGEIDALLMDINLPDGWGALVAQRLTAARPGMAIVYTTGFAEIDPILSGGLSAAEFVIRKPFTGDQLADVLNRAIAARGGPEVGGDE